MKRRIPTHGEYRTVKRFLWKPLTLDVVDTGQREWRWLEQALIRQEYYSLERNGLTGGYWKDLYFTDEIDP